MLKMLNPDKIYSPEDKEALKLLNKLIKEREDHFLHALSESAESSLLSHLKNDIDFLKEKREEIRNRVFNIETGNDY